jgi:hypothetical protein
MLPQLGKLLVILGAVLLVLGVVLLFADRIPFLGKLPGDMLIKRDRFTFYFPIVTMIILSVLITIILNLFSRGK